MLCRARRLVNPFRGVMQTIDVENADAASIDGLHWGLYIRDEASYNFIDMNSVAPFHSTDIKYGEWSEKQGLQRSPSLPSMNHDRVRELGERILEIVKTQSTNTPFPLADCYERWLLDDEQARPAVLLETEYDTDGVKYNSNTVWRVGSVAQREFSSSYEPSGADIGHAAEALQLRVNRLCKLGRTIWVRREPDGGAVILPRPGEAQGKEAELSVEAFPSYGLRSDWPDDVLNCLTRDYLHWLSPCLLLMNPAAKGLEGLATQALQYPSRLYQLRRLLPANILARKDVKAALVQANLSRSV